MASQGHQDSGRAAAFAASTQGFCKHMLCNNSDVHELVGHEGCLSIMLGNKQLHVQVSRAGLTFSSDMSFFVSTLRASSAACRAGRALSRPAWHSEAMALASSASLPILMASAFTYTTSPSVPEVAASGVIGQ